MLKPQILHSQPSKTLCLLPKPFIQSNGHASFPLNTSRSTLTKQHRNVRVGYNPAGTIKAISSATQQSTDVKATVTVKQNVIDFFSELGINRGLDDFTDLFGKTLLLELVSAEIDPSKWC